MRRQLKLWDSKREKINQPEHTASHSQNKGTEQVQRRASLLQTGPSPPEVGGSGEGKGANSAPEMAPPTALQTGLQFLTKDFLRFWMVDIARRVTAKHKVHAPYRRRWKLRLGPRRGEGAPHPGRVRTSSSWLPEPLGWGRYKTQAQPSPRFCGGPENWNRMQRRAEQPRA